MIKNSDSNILLKVDFLLKYLRDEKFPEIIIRPNSFPGFFL